MFQDLMPGCLQNWCLWNKLECNAKWLMKQVFQTYNSSLICFISASFELWLSTSSACRFVSTVAEVAVVVAMTYTSQISVMWCSYFTDFLFLKKFNRQLISNFSLFLWRHQNKLPIIGTRTITMPSSNFSCYTFSPLSKEKSAFGTLKHNASFGIAWQRIIGIMNVWFFYPIYKPHGIMQPFSLVVAIITTSCHSAMCYRFREGKTLFNLEG